MADGIIPIIMRRGNCYKVIDANSGKAMTECQPSAIKAKQAYNNAGGAAPGNGVTMSGGNNGLPVDTNPPGTPPKRRRTTTTADQGPGGIPTDGGGTPPTGGGGGGGTAQATWGQGGGSVTVW